MAMAIYAPENAQRLEAAVKEEISRALADGFTDEEVKAAKAGWLQSNQVTRAQDNSLAGRLNTVSYLNRTLGWDAELEQIVADLTPAEIKAALVKHLSMAKVSFVKAGDFAKAAAK